MFDSVLRVVSVLFALLLLSAPGVAQCSPDDAFEPNDSCAFAAAMSAGLHTGLHVSVSDEDYFRISVPAGEVLTIDQTFVYTDIEMEVLIYSDSSCTTLEAGESWGAGSNSVSWLNGSSSSVDAYVRSYIVAEGTLDCIDYDLGVTIAPDPCTVPGLDDALEDNDLCSSAATLSAGQWVNLFVSKTDPDYYEVSLADGHTIDVNATFPNAVGDIDLFLFDDGGACGTGVGSLDGSVTSTDDEFVTWTNTTGATATLFIEVIVWDGSGGDCNQYDLEITDTLPAIATPFCFGDGSSAACPCGNESVVGAGEGCKSSLGLGALLSASGSNVVANDDMTFHIAQARPGQPSMLVQGATLQALPFKDGILCTGNPTERVEVVFLDGLGAGATAGSIVAQGNLTPGLTRHYQQWFRDPGGVSPCGSGSNLSQGLTVVWN